MMANAPLLDQTFLYNVDVEQAVLGAILVSKGAVLDSVCSILCSSDFYEPVHTALFEKFMDARELGRVIDIKLTAASLGPDANAPLIGQTTVGQYVARLAAEAVTISDAPSYAKLVRELAERRGLKAIGEELVATAAGANNPAELAASAIEVLDPVAAKQTGIAQHAVSIHEAGIGTVERMTTALQNPGQITGISTGLRDLDVRTNGLQRGELAILAGRPGMGKTALAVSIARQAANAGSSALYYSCEMTADSLAARVIADTCFDDNDPIPYHNIMSGKLSTAQAGRVVDAQRELKFLPLHIEEQAGISVAQIASRARRHRRMLERTGKSLDLVVVDHMHLVKASDRYRGNRVNEVTEISGALKALAKELAVPVLALAQLSRRVEERDDKRPMLADLRDSGSIEQDADLIMFLFREGYYLERITCGEREKEDKRVARLGQVENLLEVNIAKQRNGPTEAVKLFCDIACNAVRNYAGGYR